MQVMTRTDPPKDRQAFHDLLSVLAARCGQELQDWERRMYEQDMAPYGYERACNAIMQYIRNRKSPYMPSVIQILELLDPEMSEKSEITILTNKICAAIREKGWTWDHNVPDLKAAMRERFTDVGVDAVMQFGGWAKLCQYSSENPKFYTQGVKEAVSAAFDRQRMSLPRSHHAQVEFAKKALPQPLTDDELPD